MKKTLFPTGLLMFLILAGCAKDYTTPVFSSKTIGHKKVAILPYQMVYTGRNVENLTPQDKEKIAEAEGLAFQRALHNHILKQSGTGKKKIKIEFQTPERTNMILQDSGINPVSAYLEKPERLAQVLGVDAVVYCKVEKQRYLTDLESFGLEIAGDILDKLKLPGDLNLPIGADPDFYNKTYDIRTDCQLLNGQDASLLWKFAYDTQTDWNYPANQVIENIARMSAKRFPYRQRSYYHN